ncbi:MAG: PA2779 family protein [Nitrospirota bacterium]
MQGRMRLFNTSLILYLCVALIVMGGVAAFPASGWASFVESEAAVAPSSFDRAADLGKLRVHLEQKVVAQRLADWGVSPQDVSARVAQMSDAQLHQTVAQLDSVQPGGDSGLGVIIGLLVIAILVVVLLQLTGHRVVITK